MCFFSWPQRYFLLALVTVLAIGDVGLARPVGRGVRWSGSRLGVNYGYFAGPYRGGYGRGYGNYYGYWPSYYGGGYAYPAYVPQNAPAYVNEQRSYYPPPQPATPAPATATIELYVPANAEVWFQGKETRMTGTLRRFVTPPLNPGVDYSYELRVRWTDASGEVQDQTREVVAQAGRQVILNFQDASKK
jgi:uncharacterized protein (TIGR03000 family)